MRKIEYVLDDVYNACKEEQQSNNPLVLIWLKPTNEFISMKLKCSVARANNISKEIEETYGIELLKADGYVIEYRKPFEREIWSKWMMIDLKDKKLGALVTKCLIQFKRKYSGQKLKEKMIHWAKHSKYKDQIQLIDSDNDFDDKPNTTLDRQKTKPDTSLIDELCC